MATLDAQAALDQILIFMKDRGLVTDDMIRNKADIFKNVIERLEKNDLQLTPDDLKNPNVQKRLIGAIIASTLGLKQKIDEFIAPLKLEKEHGHYLSDEPNQELDEKLKAAMILLHSLKKVQSPQPKPGTPLDEEKLKKELEALFDTQKEKKAREEAFIKIMESMLTNLNGGYNPLEPGAIRNEAAVQLIGNAMAVLFQGPANPTNLSTLAKGVIYEFGVPDELGIEARTEQLGDALGIIDASDIERDIEKGKINALYTTPKCMPN